MQMFTMRLILTGECFQKSDHQYPYHNLLSEAAHMISRFVILRYHEEVSFFANVCKGKPRSQLASGFSFWQGMRDSNPRKRSQSPVCYRYTNPLAELLSEAHDYYNDLF